MQDGLPESVGSYRLEALLGRGGMGEVYLAYDRRLERRVAIKHVRPDSGNPMAARARLRREARAAARLNHAAIVSIFELIEGDDGDWIVLELVEGETLAARLRGGALPFPEVVTIGRQLAEGLVEAHAKGIVHRDLKAENVMVTAAGQVKILDFGLAKPLVKGSEDLSISARGQVLGTTYAMSPEQARGLEVTAQSDLFSLGSLLYEMATGIAPFRGENLLDTLLRINTHQPPLADQLSPDVPGAFSALLARLLEKPPELRPRHAGEVAEALSRIERQHGLEMEPATPHGTDGCAAETLQLPGPARSRRRRHAAWLAAILVAAAAGLAFLVPRFGAGSAADPPRAADAQPSTSALYAQGMADLERFDRPGNLDRARRAFQRILAVDADSAPAYAGLARTRWRRYRFSDRDPALLDQALAAAEQAVGLDPYLADARVSRGLVYLHLGRPEAAEGDFREALLLEPTQADAHRGLGELDESRGDLEAAEAAYLEAIRLEPRNRIFHDDLGALYYKSGRYQEAETAFRESIDSAPDCHVGYRNLASTYFLLGRLEEAAEALQTALKIRPSATLYSSLGTIFFSQGLFEKSAVAFEKALSTGGNNYLYWSNLADALRQLPDRETDTRQTYLRAIQLISEQIEAKPDDPTLASRRALMLAKLGDHARALRELERLDAAGELDVHSRFRVAVGYEICGQRERATKALAAALRDGFSLTEVRRDPELRSLRADPRFHRLVMSLEAASSPP